MASDGPRRPPKNNLVSGGLTLRRWEPDDAPLFLEAALESVADVYPWMAWCHPEYSLAEAEAWCAFARAAWETDIAYEFAIYAGDQLLGGCGINGIAPAHRYANLGYWVRSGAAGRGVAATAARALAGWGFAELGLERIEVLVLADNARSLRVAEKIGAVREGVLRNRLRVHDRAHDAVMFSLIP